MPGIWVWMTEQAKKLLNMKTINLLKFFDEVCLSLWINLGIGGCFRHPESHGRISNLECEAIQSIDCRNYVSQVSICERFCLIRGKVLFIGIIRPWKIFLVIGNMTISAIICIVVFFVWVKERILN